MAHRSESHPGVFGFFTESCCYAAISLNALPIMVNEQAYGTDSWHLFDQLWRIAMPKKKAPTKKSAPTKKVGIATERTARSVMPVMKEITVTQAQRFLQSKGFARLIHVRYDPLDRTRIIELTLRE